MIFYLPLGYSGDDTSRHFQSRGFILGSAVPFISGIISP
jgi:hypothetical protein